MTSIALSEKVRNGRAGNLLLWVAQVALAGLFLFAGWVKLSMPASLLAQQTGLPGAFMRFISLAEMSGALGLVLPGLLGIRRNLTPLAAAGLVGIMIGAVVISLLRFGATAAVSPAIVGITLVALIRGRRSWLSA